MEGAKATLFPLAQSRIAATICTSLKGWEGDCLVLAQMSRGLSFSLEGHIDQKLVTA
jgi:hypothetical protein